ncbi:hypothetical protein E4T55_06755 [Legionella israelensis]|nr:hypothetical protein E4T55_06755 [Legionella israelensis]
MMSYRKGYMKKSLVVLLLLFCSLTGFAADKRFDTFVVFGDSLSDNGNLYNYMWHLLPASPPYYEGHFSNGLLWIEYLYKSYFSDGHAEGFQDYAVGGAGAILSYKENLPFTLTVELDDYLYWNTYDRKESTLYTIWIGANNYLNGPTNIEPLTDAVVDAIGGVVERIIGYGGNKFLLINLPDMGLSPQARENHMESLLTELTRAHNRKLAEKVEQLRQKYPDKIFVYFDVHHFLNYAIEHASDYGITNVTEPCYTGGYRGWLPEVFGDDTLLYDDLQKQNAKFTEKRWQMIQSNPSLLEATRFGYWYRILSETPQDEPLNCESYLFWDRVHPTTVAHYLIGQQARLLLDEAGLEAFSDNEAGLIR